MTVRVNDKTEDYYAIIECGNCLQNIGTVKVYSPHNAKIRFESWCSNCNSLCTDYLDNDLVFEPSTK